MLWLDGSNEATLDVHIISDKRIAVGYAFTANVLVENTLILCGKKLSEIYTDYHDGINREVFKRCFLFFLS